ncbi:MAG TPA: type II toxin-antitoxin system Phd/YefM family antitoxin [Chloroflexota bacterium]|nr:type II toxin-antitoxin system Phd/YefM family antitoxin [Chloroflexota bacterium]
MPAIGIKELKARAGEVVRNVESGGRYVVTKRGRPVAAIVPLADPEALYDAALDRMIGPSLAEAVEEFKSGGGVTLEDWLKG